MLDLRRHQLRSEINGILREERLREQSRTDCSADFNLPLALDTIRACFSDPIKRSATFHQIHELVELQFDPTRVWGELAGRIGSSPLGLTLEPIPSADDSHVRSAFECFTQSRSPFAAAALLHEIEQYYRFIASEHGSLQGTRIDELRQRLQRYAHRMEGSEINEEIDMGLLETILTSMTTMNIRDLRPNQLDFLGAFHFHPNGTPPNEVDYHETERSGIAMMIFSALPSSKSLHGIYLLAPGEFDVIFQE